MALLWLDGFDHYTSDTELSRRGYTINGESYLTVGGSYARYGAGGLAISSVNGTVTKSIAPSDTIYMGIAMRLADSYTPSVNPTSGFLRLMSASQFAIGLTLNSSGTIAVYRGDVSPQLIGTTSGSLVYNTWSYLEVYCYMHNTLGEFILKLDGGVELNLGPIDTYGYWASGSFDGILLSAVDSSPSDVTVHYDDFYINGSQFIGEIKVVTQHPDGDGTHTDFAPSTGVDHYAMVDEASPDDDSTYVQGGDKGDQDSYTIPGTGLDGDIVGVQLSHYAKKTDVGTLGIKGLVRVGGSDYLGDEHFLSTDYRYYSHVFENNPDTTNPWTANEVANAEYGLEITSLSTTTTTT